VWQVILYPGLSTLNMFVNPVLSTTEKGLISATKRCSALFGPATRSQAHIAKMLPLNLLA